MIAEKAIIETYSKDDSSLNNTSDPEICTSEYPPYRFKIANVPFGLGKFAFIEEATVHHSGRSFVANATANDDISSFMLSHMDC